MKVIVTEDTGSGYLLIKDIMQELEPQTTVLNSGYGSHKGTGGATRIYSAIHKMENDRLLGNEGSKVIILYDSIVVSKKDMVVNHKQLLNELRKTERFLKYRGYSYRFIDYACIEEAVMSFRVLTSLVSPLNSSIKNIIDGAYRGGYEHIEADYSRVLDATCSDTFENQLKELELSMNKNYIFSELALLSSTGIGNCWKSDCRKCVRSGKCIFGQKFIKRNKGSSRDKLRLLVKNSLLQNLVR